MIMIMITIIAAVVVVVIVIIIICQGEDIQKLEDEMKYGREQLQLADHLLSECNTISKKGTRRKTGKGRKSVIGSIRRTNRPGKKKLFSSKK